jgi:hypothetical protein
MTITDDQPPATNADFELQLITPPLQRGIDRSVPRRADYPAHLTIEPMAWTSVDTSGTAKINESAKRSTSHTDDPSKHRTGESARIWFRTSRIFNENGAWYIAPREGINVGPYHQLRRAQLDAERLIQMLKDHADFGRQVQELTIRQFLHRPQYTRKA